MIHVTKPFLPPLEEFNLYLRQIWDHNILTNNGPLARQLETKLKERLDARYLHFVSNGTIALQLAIQALEIEGDILTTPFSFVATTNSILWEKCRPVFVDIEAKTLNIDPEKLEAAITSKTRAIMAVHVYGIPCDVERIEMIAKKHGLKVIYDAAHAFDVQYKGQPLTNWGDISTLSLHATKIYHSAEGGVVICSDAKLAERISQLRNFGQSEGEIVSCGINAKNSELHAAMGLAILPHLDEILERRRAKAHFYNDSLKGLPLERPTIPADSQHNYAYYPVILPNEDVLTKVMKNLTDQKIFARRYFYPSLNRLPYVNHMPCPLAEDISRRVLCLPFHSEIKEADMTTISSIVRCSIGF